MYHLYLGWGDGGLEDFNFGGNFDVQRIGKVRRHMLLVHALTHILFFCHVRSLTKFLSNYLIVLIGHCGICVESLKMSGYGVLRAEEDMFWMLVRYGSSWLRYVFLPRKLKMH